MENKWILLIVAFLCAAAALFMNQGSRPEFIPTGTGISSCQALSSTDTYTLTSSVTINGNNCFNITASSVILDCQGYSITGNNATSTVGVLVNATGATIQNCIISNFSTAVNVTTLGTNLNIKNSSMNTTHASTDSIYMATSLSGLRIYNSTSFSASGRGFWANTLTGSEFVNVSFRSGATTYGLAIQSGNTVNITNSNISFILLSIMNGGTGRTIVINNSVFGSPTTNAIYIFSSSNIQVENTNLTSPLSIQGNAQNNTFKNMNIVATGAGALFNTFTTSEPRNNTIMSSKISGTSTAISINGGVNNTFYNNTLSTTGGAGIVAIYAGNTSGNLFYGNNFTAYAGRYVYDLNKSNFYNSTEGNLYPNVADGTVQVFGSSASGFMPSLYIGTSGSGVPYNNSTSSSKFFCEKSTVIGDPMAFACEDYAPLTPYDNIVQTFYVDATGGNDGNAGTSAGTAWKTLGRASSAYLSPGDSVLLKRGEVFSNDTLTIKNSGNATHRITVAAYGTGNPPVIDPSENITGWTVYSGNIYQTNIGAGRNISDVFINDTIRQDMAHHPNTGYYYPTTNTWNEKKYLMSTSVSKPTEDVNRTMILLRSAAWFMEARRITNYNNITGNISWATNISGSGMSTSNGFILADNLWMLDSAGEWWYNNSSGIFYLWATGSPNPSNINVSLLMKKHAINTSSGVSNMDIANISVRKAATVGILLQVVDNVTVSDVSSSYNSVYGIMANGSGQYASGGSNVHISNVTADFNRQFGIMVMSNHSSVVESNVSNTGMTIDYQRDTDSFGISSHWSSRNVTLSRNTVINTSRVAMSLGGNSSTASLNYINGSCMLFSDCGGFYQTWVVWNNTWDGNIITNVPGNNTASYGVAEASGIYFDSASDDIYYGFNTVKNNIIHGADTSAIFQHETGRNTTYVNNTLYGSQKSIYILEAYDISGLLTNFTEIFFVNNTVLQKNSSLSVAETSAYTVNQSKWGNFTGNIYYPIPNSSFANVTNNLTFPTENSQKYTHAQWKTRGIDMGSRLVRDTYVTQNDTGTDKDILFPINTNMKSSVKVPLSVPYCEINNTTVISPLTLPPFSGKPLLACFCNNDLSCNNNENNYTCPGDCGAVSAGAFVNVPSCGVLSANNLVVNITNSLASFGTNCLNVTGNNITVVCNGNNIEGNSTDGTIGIYVTGSNANIQNCNVSGYLDAVKGAPSVNLTIIGGRYVGNTTSSSRGIHLTGASDYVNISGVYAEGASEGIYSITAKNGSIWNSTMNATVGRGLYLISPNYRIWNATIHGAGNGFQIAGAAAANNTLSNSTVYSSGGSGIFIFTSDNNTIRNVTIINPGVYGVLLQNGADDNTFDRINISNSTQTAFILSVSGGLSGSGNRIENSTIEARASGSKSVSLANATGNRFYNNTLKSILGGILLELDIRSSGNTFWLNNFTNTTGLYANDTNGSNTYNLTEGNLWGNVVNGSVNISGINLSSISGLYVGLTGSQYPYNSSNSFGRFSCNFDKCGDYAPFTPTFYSNPNALNATLTTGIYAIQFRPLHAFQTNVAPVNQTSLVSLFQLNNTDALSTIQIKVNQTPAIPGFSVGCSNTSSSSAKISVNTSGVPIFTIPPNTVAPMWCWADFSNPAFGTVRYNISVSGVST